MPVLLRRIVENIDPFIMPVIPRGFQHPSGSMRRRGGLERAVEAVAERYPAHAVMVVMDSDDDCPKDLGPLNSNAEHPAHDLTGWCRWYWRIANTRLGSQSRTGP